LRRRVLAIAFAAAMLAFAACAVASAAITRIPSHQAAAAARSSLQRSWSRFELPATAMFESVLSQIAKREFLGGVWHPESPCWRCGTELGAVAAIVSRAAPAGPYRRWAISTFDAVAKEHQEANGAFGPPAGGDQISTGAELVSMGTAFLELEPVLSSPERARWAATLDRAARWLVGGIDFYINGNVNLQETLGLYLAWRATDDPSLLTAYHRSWSFTLAPGPRWPGFGLVYTRKTSSPLGADGAAYLAEQGAGAPGFDPHYTILQADYAAELYALSRGQQVLRLLNLLMNQLFTRVNKDTLVIQTGGGSRHPEPGSVGLSSPQRCRCSRSPAAGAIWSRS